MAAVPPYDAADIDIDCAAFKFYGLDKGPHFALLGGRQEMQFAVGFGVRIFPPGWQTYILRFPAAGSLF